MKRWNGISTINRKHVYLCVRFAFKSSIKRFLAPNSTIIVSTHIRVEENERMERVWMSEHSIYTIRVYSYADKWEYGIGVCVFVFVCDWARLFLFVSNHTWCLSVCTVWIKEAYGNQIVKTSRNILSLSFSHLRGCSPHRVTTIPLLHFRTAFTQYIRSHFIRGNVPIAIRDFWQVWQKLRV